MTRAIDFIDRNEELRAELIGTILNKIQDENLDVMTLTDGVPMSINPENRNGEFADIIHSVDRINKTCMVETPDNGAHEINLDDIDTVYLINILNLIESDKIKW